MKKFYDRQQEMNQLLDMQRQAFEDYSRFVVLTGRRRVGKTSLVTKLMEETKEQAPGLYFFVGRKTEAVLVKTFCEMPGCSAMCRSCGTAIRKRPTCAWWCRAASSV